MLKTNYKDRLSKLFASFAIVAFGALAVMNTFLVSGSNPGIASVIFALKISIPSAFILGFIGYALGSVLDKRPKKRKPIIFSTAAGTSVSPAHKIESVFAQDSDLEELPLGGNDE